jgi:cobalamin-dependent methionine synthase I
LPQIVEIRGGYTIFEDIEIQQEKGIIRLHEREIVPQKRVCTYLKNSEKIAVFICSAGEQFSILSKKANAEGDYLKGYLIDTFGSLVAEKTADFIQNEIQKVVQKEDLKITNRYSPGYCNWHLSNQKELFALLPENPCHIFLTDSSLMLPIKSVSGIIGIGKNVRHFGYKCQICNDKDCTYRWLVTKD